MAPDGSVRIPRVFFDADMLVAGSASTSGASHALLRTCGATILHGLCSAGVATEARRTIVEKIPSALPQLEAVIAEFLSVVPDPEEDDLRPYTGWAAPDDLPHFVAATLNHCDFFVTFNTRHYYPKTGRLLIVSPSKLILRLRRSVAGMLLVGER